MKLRALLAISQALALLSPHLVLGQGTPVYQDGTVVPNHIAKFLTNGRIGDGGAFSPVTVKGVVVSGAACDSVQNDTGTINTELAALGTAGGGVYQLPSGHCTVSTLSLPGSVTIRGAGYGATVLTTTSATGNVITVTGAGAEVTDLWMASTPERTAGSYIISAWNNTHVRNMIFTGYFNAVGFIGNSSADPIVAPYLENSIGFSPAIRAGSSFVVFHNFSSGQFRGNIVSGPTTGVQPDSGLTILGGDTLQVSDNNISMHGAALSMNVPAGGFTGGVTIVNSVFDSAGTTSSGDRPSCLIAPAGNLFDVWLSNSWCGLASKIDNLQIYTSGSGSVDGLHMSNMIFERSTLGSGVAVTGPNVKNWTLVGGSACGNKLSGVGVNNSSRFIISGLIAGVCSAGGPNNVGINILAAASDYYWITNNITVGNTTAGVFDGGTGTHKVVTQLP